MERDLSRFSGDAGSYSIEISPSMQLSIMGHGIGLQIGVSALSAVLPDRRAHPPTKDRGEIIVEL